MLVHLGRERFDISTRAVIVGVLDLSNGVTDGGGQGAASLVEAGTDMIEIVPSANDDETTRIVAEAVEQFGIPVSILTGCATLAEACFAAGAVMVNDPSGFADPLLLPIAADALAAVIAHSPPAADANQAALTERIQWAEAAGIPVEQVLVASAAGQASTTRSMIDLTSLGEEEANGAAVTAMMNGVRVLRTTNVKAVRRVAATVSELLIRRGVLAPDAVEPLGSESCL